MGNVKQYLLTVTTASLICAVVKTLSGSKGAVKSVLQLLSGVFLALTVVSPWLNLSDLDLSTYIGALQNESIVAVSLGESMAEKSTGEIIKDKTTAYILDKANSMDLDVEVEVTLDGSDPPQPCAVSIKGSASPYSKEILKEYIESNLGISKENQSWI